MHTFIDLFAGAGGLSAGFAKAGLQPIFAVEKDTDAAATYRLNHGDIIIESPIEELTDSHFPKADVLIGGPPCQGFSPLGRMNGGRQNSQLNTLWQQYMRVIALATPKVFVLENVPQLLRSAEFVSLEKAAHILDYQLNFGVLNSVDFGVPQRRRRAIVIGSRVGPPSLPQGGEPHMTVRAAIGGLREPAGEAPEFYRGKIVSGSQLHFVRNPQAKSLARYRLIPPGGNRFDLMRLAPELTPPCWLNKPTGSTDVFGRLKWDEPSVTIRTEFFKPEKGRYLHPSEDRPITHLEAVLLQGFSPSFLWTGTKSSIARQIGEAVPPGLAYAAALTILPLLAS